MGYNSYVGACSSVGKHSLANFARGPVAQLVELHSHCRGKGFDSPQVHFFTPTSSEFRSVSTIFLKKCSSKLNSLKLKRNRISEVEL